MSEATISTIPTIPQSPLPGKSLRELRARAHTLKPVVRISGNGATETVLREIDRSLRSHELIKIHAAVDGRSDREALMSEVCAATSAHAVQIIGKMLVVYRQNPQAPEPAPAGRRAPAKGPSRKSAARSAPDARRRAPAKTRSSFKQR